MPVRFGTRSLSVGDLLRVDDAEVWVVQVLGWTLADFEPKAVGPAG